MKLLFPFLIFFLCANFALTQDTLQKIPDSHGFQKLLLLENGDSILITKSPLQQLESRKLYRQGQIVLDTRYYDNGEVMWKQERSNNQANGQMHFFASDGVLLGTLNFRNDTIVDTVFIHPKRPFVFGRFTYYSIIHGGRRPPDGSSNISGGAGIRSFTDLYLVRLDSTMENQTKYAELRTDVNGYFFQEVTHGTYGIFPDYFPIDQVTATMGTPIGLGGRAIEMQWTPTAPIDLTEANYCYIPFHYHSVGYAP